MKKFLIIPILLIIFTSCEKENKSEMPNIPATDSIDINNDSLYDFVISYSIIATTDEPSSGQSIIGELIPLDSNEVLYRQSVGHLFLQQNDTIRKVNNTNAEWTTYQADLITKDNINDKWDSSWTILSDLNDDYYIGFKLKGSTEQIGWMLINPNTNTGEISIIDKEFTDSNELIIQN